MSGMFWIALELSIPKIGFNIMISWTVKKVDAFKFDGVAVSDNTAWIFDLDRTDLAENRVLCWFGFTAEVPVTLYRDDEKALN